MEPVSRWGKKEMTLNFLHCLCHKTFLFFGFCVLEIHVTNPRHWFTPLSLQHLFGDSNKYATKMVTKDKQICEGSVGCTLQLSSWREIWPRSLWCGRPWTFLAEESQNQLANLKTVIIGLHITPVVVNEAFDFLELYSCTVYYISETWNLHYSN